MTAAGGGRSAEARRIGEAALASGGDAVALNAMLGAFCLQSGDFDRAAHHLRIAHAARPDDPIIALNLGTALAQLGAFAEALDAAPEELARKDPSLRLQRLRAFCSQSSGDYPAAIETYQRIVAAARS